LDVESESSSLLLEKVMLDAIVCVVLTGECDSYLNKIADLRSEAEEKSVPLEWNKLLKTLETKANVKHQAPRDDNNKSKRSANNTDGSRNGNNRGGSRWTS